MKLRYYSMLPEPRLNRECISCTPPEADDRLIGFSDCFKFILHPNQTSVGTTILAARRHVARIADFTDGESKELLQWLQLIEPAAERSFGAELINIYYQRNWAYRKENPDPPFKNGQPNPHAHFHIMPRYSRPVRFGGEEWEDASFGEPFVWEKRAVGEEMKRSIIRRIQEQLPLDEMCG